MSLDVPSAAAWALATFVALSFYDGVVVHFFVERLPLRPASRLEHRLHTARAMLFPAVLVAFFGGRATALGWVLLALDQGLEVWDMAVERQSREHTNGLPSSEYVVHGLLTTLRAAAVALTAAIDRARMDARSLDALVFALLPGAVLAGVVHVAFATAPGRALLAHWRSAS